MTVTVWILFTWMGANLPAPGLFPYETKTECEQRAADYKRAVCVKVDVPKR